MPEIPLLAAKDAGRAHFDVQLSSVDYNMRAHILMHPVQDPGGNPVLIYRHGGGGVHNDCRLPFIGTGNGNALCYYLSQHKVGPQDAHFTIISLSSPQSEFRNGTALTRHSEDSQLGWSTGGVRTRVVSFPSNVEYLQAGIVALKSKASTYNLDPNKFFLMGTSFGAGMVMLSQLLPPMVHTRLQPSALGLGPGPLDSTVRGVIPHQAITDIRSRIPAAPFDRQYAGCSWNDATLTLTLSATAPGLVADADCFVFAGTDATLGQYKVVSVPSSTTVVLDRSIGVSASNVSVYLTTEKYGPGSSTASGSISDVMGFSILDSNSVPTDYLALPDNVRATYSAAYYLETDQWPSWAPPMYFCTESLGNHIQPYGAPAVGTATGTTVDIHDSQMIVDLLELARNKGVNSIGGQVFPFSDWETQANGGDFSASETVYQWMRTVMGTQREPLPPINARPPLVRLG